MAGRERKVRIAVGPRRIVAAFFDPEDLRRWLGADTSTAEPRDGGTYRIRWSAVGSPPAPPGPGTLLGTVEGYDLTTGFSLSACRWVPETGDPEGAIRLTVRVDSKINQSTVRVELDGILEGGAGAGSLRSFGDAWTGWLERLRTYLEDEA